MPGPVKNPRVPEAKVDAAFLERWSPRAFSLDPIEPGDIASLFEAARWAPSSFNGQPWLFLYSSNEEERQRFLSLLVEVNQTWARHAPVLGLILAKRKFDRNGRPNRHYAFDTGAAWMALALQARRLGLDTHAMGGFDEARSYDLLGVPRDEYEAMAAIAIGRRGDPGDLPENLAEKEVPSDRKPLAAVAIAGSFPAGGLGDR